jgi:hypothetical protein
MPVMPTSVVADVVLALALAVYGELLLRLRRADGPTPPWWLGYARDATNVAAALMMWGAYLGLGYPPAVAFLAASLTTLCTYMIDWVLARGLRLRHARTALAAVLTAWVALVTLRTTMVGHFFGHLVDAVQPSVH